MQKFIFKICHFYMYAKWTTMTYAKSPKYQLNLLKKVHKEFLLCEIVSFAQRLASSRCKSQNAESKFAHASFILTHVDV